MTANHDALREKLDEDKAVGEPVACVYVSHHKGLENRDFDYWGDLPDGSHMLYTHPQPQAERVPLTDAQIMQLSTDCYQGGYVNPLVNFARAIEAAHGIGKPV